MVVLSSSFVLGAILFPMTCLTAGVECIFLGLAPPFLDFCFEIAPPGLGAFFLFLFFFAEEEEDSFSITCALLAWPRIPSAACSFLRSFVKYNDDIICRGILQDNLYLLEPISLQINSHETNHKRKEIFQLSKPIFGTLD